MKPEGLNVRRLLVIAIVLLIVLAGLLYAFRSVVREVIIIPISYLFWLAQTFFDSTPQYFFWILTLVITALVAWRSFRGAKPPPEYVPKVPDIGAPGGRVSYWAARVNLMRLGEYYQSTFNEAIGRLALDLIAYRHRLSNRQIEKGLTNGTLQAPPEVREFILTQVLRRDYRPVPFITYLYRAVRLWYLTRFSKNRSARENLKPSVQSIIKYMEEELEVHYDNTGH